jgi:5-(carboxyamino)imidazole ribonucleotide mutase
VALNAAHNAGILAAQIIAVANPALFKKLTVYKESLKRKVDAMNREIKNLPKGKIKK